MRQLLDHSLGEILYEGLETRVQRATNSPRGSGWWSSCQLRYAELRTLGRLMHEHQILSKLAQVPGVVRSRAQPSRAAARRCSWKTWDCAHSTGCWPSVGIYRSRRGCASRWRFAACSRACMPPESSTKT